MKKNEEKLDFFQENCTFFEENGHFSLYSLRNWHFFTGYTVGIVADMGLMWGITPTQWQCKPAYTVGATQWTTIVNQLATHT